MNLKTIQLPLLTACSLLAVFSATARTLHVRDLGAAGDGVTLDTTAIQAAIDRAAADGGGTVVLAGGRFLSGTIFLRSHVTLRIEAGATLLGSTNLADYPARVPKIRSYTLTGLQVTGKDTRQVTFIGNDFRDTGRITDVGSEVPRRAVTVK